MNAPAIGCTKDELDTPALCIDLDRMESNIQSMMDACRENGVDWRPHSKCHKSTAIARKLLDAGAVGLTCAKLGEAEVMAAAGIQDLLIANLVVGPAKVERLVQLRRLADPIVCIDHVDQARPLSDAMHAAGLQVRTLIEVDIGLERVGVPPGPEAVQLARRIDQLPGLRLAGVMGYEGHLLRVPDPDEKETRIRESLAQLVDTQKSIQQAGLDCDIVSCGGTGSFRYSVRHPGITEVQAGGAIFMDEFYRKQCQVADLEFALTVLASVVSRPAPDRAIIDAGRKTLNPEHETPRVIGRAGIEVAGLSAEHGKLQLHSDAQDLKIGDKIEMIPGYGDLTTVLHDKFYGFRGNRLEAIWPLEARGKLQ